MINWEKESKTNIKNKDKKQKKIMQSIYNGNINKKKIAKKLSYVLVPEAGLEPARCCHRWILSPVRLPIPSLRLVKTTLV